MIEKDQPGGRKRGRPTGKFMSALEEGKIVVGAREDTDDRGRWKKKIHWGDI